MAVVIDGTTGISTPAETVLGNLSYTGTLTGNGGIVNLGSGQMYKDASGNVGIGTSSPTQKLTVAGGIASTSAISALAASTAFFDYNSGNGRFAAVSGTTGAAAPITFSQYSSNGSVGRDAATIDSSGNLLINTTTQLNNSNSYLNILYDGGNFYGSTFKATSSAGTAIAFINSSGTSVGSITQNNTATSYITSSDYRLKEAIAPMAGALAKVALLKPCTYKWKVDGSDGQGFIAHELAEVEAGCVTGEKDAVDADGNPQYQGIDTSFLVATLAAAIQEQQTLIEQQSAALTALTARITALETAA